MRCLLLSLLGFLSVEYAMAADSREEALRTIAMTLASINAEMAQANYSQNSLEATVHTASVVERALKTLTELAEEYKNNPYVEVTGFTIGLPWNLSINLDIKSPPQDSTP